MRTYEAPKIKKETEKLLIMEKLLASSAKRIEKEPDLKFLQDFFKEFSESNIYLVGGMVRDAALGIKKMAKDFDFVVNKIDLDSLTKFLETKGKVDLVGRNFGVLKFMPKNSELEEPIDIALPRTEFSTGAGGGYKDFAVQSDPNLKIEEDLSRRDLTINALALDLKNKKIIDPYGGLQNLANGEIKAVLKPEDRFKEDYSRMLRALRFATKFDFTIEKNTWQAITDLAPKINQTRKNKDNKTERIVPTETIAKEFLKSLSTQPVKTIELYDQAGFLQQLMPELLELKNCEQPKEFHSEGDAWQHTLLCLKNLQSPEFKKQFNTQPPLEVIVALLFHDIDKPETKIYNTEKKRFTFPGHEKSSAILAGQIANRLTFASYNGLIDYDDLKWLISNHMISKAAKPKEIKATKLEKLFFANPQLGEKLLMLCFADDISCLTPEGPSLEGYKILKKRLTELKELSKTKKNLPAPLIDGFGIITEFDLIPGPKIGKLLNLVREAQLNGEITSKEEALDLIRKNFTKYENNN